MTDGRLTRAAAFAAHCCPDCGDPFIQGALTDLWRCPGCGEQWYLIATPA